MAIFSIVYAWLTYMPFKNMHWKVFHSQKKKKKRIMAITIIHLLLLFNKILDTFKKKTKFVN